jgi:uncharacterized phage protein (TIGR01671 family)
MREIKFRAWDEARRYMITSDLDHIDFEKSIAYWYDVTADIDPETGEQGTPYQIHAESSVIPLQYTGLKDKNGKEIYGGDIVNCSFKLKDNEPQYFNAVPVEFDPVWGTTISPLDVYSLGRCREIEVIGNIYENPELISQ